MSGCESPVLEDQIELVPNIVREVKPSPSSKRIKLGHEKSYAMFKEGHDQKNTHGDENGLGAENNSGPKRMVNAINPISDSVIFKYCLGGLDERCSLLKEIVISASEEQIENFGKQVSLFSGCSHHWHQIKIAKRLMEEGVQVWALMTEENDHVPWEDLVPVIIEHFKKIASSIRPLAYRDLECLRRISGAQDLVYRENFERMWSWLYPVALTIAQRCVNVMWISLSPMWMKGFITKEEAEILLRSQENFHPGTFVLRFPSSRSWPHPDAGSLVVTYVGSDYMIHHRLLSLDFANSASKDGSFKPLHEMLLEEHELSRPAKW